MADNFVLNSGTGGVTLAADDITSVWYQRIKLTDGTADSTTEIAAGGGVEANALRVTIASDSTGVLSIDDGGGSLTIDGTVTANLSATDNAVLDSIDTAVNLIDDVIYVDDADWTALTSKHALIGGVYNSVDRTVTDGDTAPIAVDVNGHLITSPHAESIALPDNVSNTVKIQSDHAGGYIIQAVYPYYFDGATWDRARGDATNGLLVNLGANNDITGTVTANLSATDNAVLDQIEVNTSYGDSVGGGTEAAALRVTIASDSTGVLSIDDNGGAITVDNGGTFAVQAASAGDVAHDTADSGNPVKIGAKATNSIEGLTQVAANDRTDVRADLNGVLITRPYTTPEEILSERVSDTTGTSTAFTNFAAGGAGVHNYVTTITVYNSSGSDGYVDFRDGTAGSIIFTAPAPASSGCVIHLPVPLKGAANTALAYDVSAALSTVFISVVGYQAQG